LFQFSKVRFFYAFFIFHAMRFCRLIAGDVLIASAHASRSSMDASMDELKNTPCSKERHGDRGFHVG
jgi:hypothetical protein